jgi:hypothetical protein
VQRRGAFPTTAHQLARVPFSHASLLLSSHLSVPSSPQHVLQALSCATTREVFELHYASKLKPKQELSGSGLCRWPEQLELAVPAEGSC